MTYISPFEEDETDYQFHYNGKQYYFNKVQYVTWDGARTVEAMDQATLWTVRYGFRNLKVNPMLLDAKGRYFLQEMAFPG